MNDTNKTAHTPGPWECRVSGAFVHIHRTGDPFAPIAHMNYTVGEELCIERARLIAAAPELLEALGLLLNEVDASAIAGAKDYGWPLAVEKSRAAIHKATGAPE